MKKVKILIRLVERNDNTPCHRGHQVGDTFDFDADRGKLCPMAFHALFPYVDILRYGGSVPPSKDGRILVSCPDAETRNIFEIIPIHEQDSDLSDLATFQQTELILWQKMIEIYSAEDPAQISHTQSVVDYTQKIAELEGLEPHRIFLLKIAAILHDIGCPAARAVSGKSLPPMQEKEGARIAEELLQPVKAFSPEEKSYIVSVVGSHHQIRKAEELHFEPLFEADLIVNLLEGYYDRTKAAFYREQMVHTEAGKKIFNLIFQKDLH